MTRRTSPSPHRLSAALLAALLVPITSAALAQDTGAATTLDKVTVTGSLIPQSQIETFTPVTVVTAEDIQLRGFQSVADILQQSTFTTGGLQGGQTSASFTQGAEAAGMFSLDPGYTKYLINGRPMSNYPALYNGSDTFNNISGIPVALVERIEILPGGQSSLYGSDAIAGVVNVILKKDVDGGEFTVRGGWFGDGGGASTRFTFADSFGSADGRIRSLLGLQFEERDPIWGYQRDLTKQFNTKGYTAPVASRDYLVIDELAGQYVFADPNDCANVTGQFGGTVSKQDRPGFGEYCGSFITAGHRTIRNGKQSSQLYSYTTFDISDSTQLYAEVLGNYEESDYFAGSGYTWWGTGVRYGAFYDPDLDKLVNLQRAFSPEDIGGRGFHDIMDTDRNKAYTVTLGANGALGAWDYDAYVMRAEYKLTERKWSRFADPIDAWFSENVLGPQLDGVDPFFGAYPIFRPDYDAFYRPMSPNDFATFTGYVTNQSRTWNNLAHVQFTNGSLFSLPGGDAGFAVVGEVGNEGWEYAPDARLVQDPDTLESQVWGTTSVSGNGRRSRYAVTSELRMPLLDPLTVTLSGRYDAFDIAGDTVDKPTYSIGLEYRPVESLLVRGKYGTAFRAPTLADVFQGLSGFYGFGTDYFRCAGEGFLPGNTDQCSYDSEQYFGQQSGNRELEPITADVWNAGIVWAPIQNLSLAVDYYSWDIDNEVKNLTGDQLLLSEYYCRTGASGSPVTSCDNVLDWVTRSANGQLTSILTPKVNIASQRLRALTTAANYSFDAGNVGNFALAVNYTNNLEHTLVTQPGQAELDLLRDPIPMWNYDSYAKTRTDATVAWSKGDWTTTLYGNRIGSTPNNLAYLGGSFDYVHPSGARAGKWGSYTTYNLSVNWRALENLTFSVLVNNLFDKSPEYQANNYPGTASTPYNNYLYNPYGRAFYLEAKYQFGQ